MKHIHHSPSLLVQFRGQCVRWDARTPLSLGFPVKLVLQRKENEVYIRDFSSTLENVKQSLVKFTLDANEKTRTVHVAGHDLIFTALKTVQAPQADRVSAMLASGQSIPFSNIAANLEDLFFKKTLKQFLSSAAVAFLLLFLIHLGEDTPQVNEEIIPKKFAKLLLSKPKPNGGASSSASVTNSAQKMAITHAIQSKTVQKSIQQILKSSMTKHLMMATGRSIASITQKMQATGSLNLNTKANALMGSAAGSNGLVGSSTGYGSNGGSGVSGQGSGQGEIGLNTNDATVDEGLTKEEVAKVIHAHLSEIRYCYESAMLKDATLSGKILVDFKINPQGMIGSSSVSEATLKDQKVSLCLVSRMKAWKFPNPRGGVHVAVSYPFIFKSMSR